MNGYPAWKEFGETLDWMRFFPHFLMDDDMHKSMRGFVTQFSTELSL